MRNDNIKNILKNLEIFWENNPDLRFSQIVSLLDSKIDYYDSNVKALGVLKELNKRKDKE